MTLCDDGHEEVCYECRNCPACEIKRDAEKEQESLNNRIEELQKEVDAI